MSRSHSITVMDADSTSVTLATVSVVASGATQGSPDNATLLSFLRVASANLALSPATSSASTTYTFDPGTCAFDFLKAGATLTLTYKLAATDNGPSGGETGNQTIIVTVTGTNDGVTYQTPDVVLFNEAEDGQHQLLGPRSGSIALTDLDVGDTLAGSVLVDGVVKLNGNLVIENNGNIGGSNGGNSTGEQIIGQSTLAWLGLKNAISVTPIVSTGGAVALTYSYNPLAANLDFLAEGDVVTIEYVVDVSDGTAHQPVTVAFKIVGTNDAPVFVSGTDAGAINDTVAADTFDNLSGALVAFDPDSGAQLSYALANGQSPIGLFGKLTLETGGSYEPPWRSPPSRFQNQSRGPLRHAVDGVRGRMMKDIP